jgi:hypothetical protein
MSAGRYRDRATLETPTTTNVRGVQQRSWAASLTRVPVQVETATAARLERLFPVGDGGRIESVQTHVVSVRGRIPVRLKDRWVWHDPASGTAPDAPYAPGDRFLEVTAIHTLGARRDVTVMGCEERER